MTTTNQKKGREAKTSRPYLNSGSGILPRLRRGTSMYPGAPDQPISELLRHPDEPAATQQVVRGHIGIRVDYVVLKEQRRLLVAEVDAANMDLGVARQRVTHRGIDIGHRADLQRR